MPTPNKQPVDLQDFMDRQSALIEKAVELEGRLALDVRTLVPARPVLHADDPIANCALLEAHCKNMQGMLDYRQKHPCPVATFEKLAAQGNAAAGAAAMRGEPLNVSEKCATAPKPKAEEPPKDESKFTATERCMALKGRPATGSVPMTLRGVSHRCELAKSGQLPPDAPKPPTASERCLAAKAEAHAE